MLTCLLLSGLSEARVAPPLGFSRSHFWKSPRKSSLYQTPGVPNCTEKYYTQVIDHFNWGPLPTGAATYKQRYFICDQYFKKANSPIFFYCGNEANVELYVNHTGFMWELAAELGALLVFAEHRYYGKSLPFGGDLKNNMYWLSSEQALADFATLIRDLKAELKTPKSAVIGFGGSYGGMLAAWLRIKYPWAIDGALSASAPIWSFLYLDPPHDPNSFAKIETADASVDGGSAANCASNVRIGWPLIWKYAATSSGRDALQDIFGLCYKLNTTEDGYALSFWLRGAWDYMAMGNYPYPSDYITNGDGVLPAFPVRVACQNLAPNFSLPQQEKELLTALRAAASVFYNVSGTQSCFDIGASVNNETTQDGAFWDFQYCTEMVQPFEENGKVDMFWDDPFSLQDVIARCKETWGVVPRADWATIEYGGRSIMSASNIVFSNGNYDPWAGGGVLRNLSSSLIALIIPEAAHHLDLMFSNPQDPPALKAVRNTERSLILQWIASKGQGDGQPQP